MLDRQSVRTLASSVVLMTVLVAVGWLVYREATRAPASPPPRAAQAARLQPPSPLASSQAPPPRREAVLPSQAQAALEPASDQEQREEINRLRLRLAELERERDTALAEAAKYERALQRAVAEMNTQEARHGANLAASAARVASAARYSQSARGAEPYISVYGVRAEVLADRIIVFGDVRNIGNAAGGERIARIRLLEDGREVASQQLSIDVGLHTDVPIQATFYRTAILGAIYSARIDVES